MLVKSGERIPIARLLKFLELGERLAHDCAKGQVLLAPGVKERRFLMTQSKQEAYHALVFQGAIAWLAPRQLGDSPLLPALNHYRRLLEDSLAAGDWYESLMGEQIILEGLGEALLKRLDDGLAKRQAPFGRLRRILLCQEEAHHGFGLRMLGQAIDEGRISVEQLRKKAPYYLALTKEMVMSVGDLFDTIDEDVMAWAAGVDRYLPEWLTPAGFSAVSTQPSAKEEAIRDQPLAFTTQHENHLRAES